MTKTLLALLMSLAFIGCSSGDSSTPAKPKLALNNSLSGLTLNDQFDKPHTLPKDTKTVIFAFSKEMGHLCNDFFVTQDASYLADNNAVFIADVSSAPSIIRSMFIMPGLKDFEHTVLILDDSTTAAGFKAGVNTEKVIVVSLENATITKIDKAFSVNELKALIKK